MTDLNTPPSGEADPKVTTTGAEAQDGAPVYGEPLLQTATLGALDLRGAGELITQSFHVASSLHRVEPITLEDPRDKTNAPAFLTDQTIKPVDLALFDQYRAKPLWRTGTANHTRLASFVDHVNRFKADHSVIFAKDDPQAPSLLAVFDYHPEGAGHSDTEAGRHRAKYAFPLSEQWKTWTKSDGVAMPMADFALFLENNIVDVVADAAPSSDAAKDYVAKVGGNIASPSTLINISRNLQVNESSQFREARNLTSGEAEILFTTQHTDASGAKLVLPNLFMICIPVFAQSDEFWQIFARFRYRKSGGSIVFWYELWRVDLVFEGAFSAACDIAANNTGLPLFFGSPEL